MRIFPSKTKELMLILSPDTCDRGTEIPFLSLFEKKLVIVTPPKYLLPDEINPIPHADSVLLFEGGTDISSEFYGQQAGPKTQTADLQRDIHEELYFKMAQQVGASIIGICRGAQLACALSGGNIIQDVGGHDNIHPIEVKHGSGSFVFPTTSSHHQLMNPYVLPPTDWDSFGHAKNVNSGKYRGEHNKKIRVFKKWKNWKDQEIVWFKKTRSLAIQGHPEWFEDQKAVFVQYCKFLVNFLILKEKAEKGDETIQTP